MTDHYVRKTLHQNKWTLRWVAFVVTVCAAIQMLDTFTDML